MSDLFPFEEIVKGLRRAQRIEGRAFNLRMVQEESLEAALVVLHLGRGKATQRDLLDEGCDLILQGVNACLLAGADEAGLVEALSRKLAKLNDQVIEPREVERRA